jgi:hypothetical protein
VTRWSASPHPSRSPREAPICPLPRQSRVGCVRLSGHHRRARPDLSHTLIAADKMSLPGVYAQNVVRGSKGVGDRLFEGEEAVLHLIERIVAPPGPSGRWFVTLGGRATARRFAGADQILHALFPSLDLERPSPRHGRGASDQGRPSAHVRRGPRSATRCLRRGPSPFARRVPQRAQPSQLPLRRSRR